MDFRKLNQVAKFDTYPMPRIEEMFEKIGSANVISMLDLAKGYWHIPMTPDSQEKTVFVTPFGLFEFTVMPFGLHNAPATFQRIMNHVLRECRDIAFSAMVGENIWNTCGRSLANFSWLV